MTTAGDVIQAGYARSTANDPGKLATDAELLGRLNRNFQSMYSLAARQRPDAFASLVTVTLDANAALPLAADYIEVRQMKNAAGQIVHLIPANETLRLYHVAPCMYQLGSSLFSRLYAGDPLSGDVLTAQQLLAAAPLTTLASVLDVKFPTRHHEVLIGDLGLYLDAKDEGRDPRQFRKLAADQSVKLAAFAGEYALEASALEFMHDVVDRVDSKESGA